tara:strand:+ start:89 stop:433 length:345 start_codon:yes stop_codon:yes gene_type:complete
MVIKNKIMELDKCFNCKETMYLIYNTLLADTSCENCGKWQSEEEKELILKVAERYKEWNFEGFKYDDVAEIVLTYGEGWKYEGEEMIELIDEIISVKDNIIRSLNSTHEDLPIN